MRKSFTVMVMAITLAITMAGAAIASSTMLDPFTETELTNWQADRQFPSGGVDSVTFEGRDNVASIGIVGADRSTVGSFYYFEGIKKVDDFGVAVQVDLYVPGEWENAATSPLNVGFWTSDDPLSAYPLIVFRNGDSVDAGFYVYDTVTGEYGDSGVDVAYESWNTLSITLDPDNEAVNYAINGQNAGSFFASGGTIGEVFLNHYNDGANDYTAHWHAGVESIDSKDQCKDGNWETHAQDFKNQGQCIKFVNTGK